MFNTSTRKEDMSLKLRSQNLRNAKQQTRILEAESRRMEDRLEELKVAMTREKEEREAGGGGFWSSGQEGNLGNYAQEVLKKPKKGSSASSNREKSSKKSRVKVLKDEPIVVPERKKAPGTMGNIAQRNLVANKEKIKGPRCGQCEQKAANVSCQECGEDYCAGCFAAFHLKGALKKHRSVPVGSTGMRPNMTPRSAASNTSNSARSVYDTTNNDVYNNNHNNHLANGRHSPTRVTHGMEQNPLMDGDYDEQANAAEFQAALAAWRTGKAAVDTDQPAVSPTPVQNKPKVMVPRPARKQQQLTSSESGTSTQEEKPPPIEIKFKSSLTYAERLLLKKHRRTELGMSPCVPLTAGVTAPTSPPPEPDPDSFEDHVSFDEVVGLVTPRGGAMDPFSESAHVMPRTDTFYHTTDSHLVDEMGERSESRLSIIEVDNVPAHRLRKYEQSSNYEVTEGPDDTMYNIEQSRVSPDAVHARYAFATPPTSGRPSPSGRRSTSARRSYTVSPISAALKHSKENLAGVLDDPDQAMTVISQGVLLKKSGNVSARQTPVSSARSARTPRGKPASKDRPASRAKSRGGNRPESRPVSRAKSRTYMYGEGLLTKGPSESLKEVARLAGQMAAPEYEKGADLAAFFTVGVKPMQPKERVMTPSGQRKNQKQPEAGIQKWKVSNKLYSLGPRSWRPDSSLGDNVDERQVADHLEDGGVAHLEQMTSEALTDLITPRDREESTLSWSWSQHVTGDAPTESLPTPSKTRNTASKTESRKTESQNTESVQASGSFRPVSRSSRERSFLRKEKRDQALQQGEDMFSLEPRPMSSSLRLQPGTTSNSRQGTPRNLTPRPNSRGTNRPDSGRPGSRTPMNRGNSSLYAIPASMEAEGGRLTPSRPYSASGRESRAIVVDGDDLSRFDELQSFQHQDDEDEEAIGQLEWELASQEGRVTADGQISRMSMIDPDADLDIPEDTGPGCGLDSPPPQSRPELLDRQIRESVLMDDFSDMEDEIMADEVKALH